MKRSLLYVLLCLTVCVLTPAAAAAPEAQYDTALPEIRDLPPAKLPGIHSADTVPNPGEEDLPVHVPAGADASDGDSLPYGAPVDGIYPNAGALYEQWMRERESYEASPYPSYICGVWSTDGDPTHLTFAVTKDEAGEAGKEEILSQIADGSTVSFTYQSYPYAALWAVQLDLQTRLGDESGAYAIGIHEQDNRVCITIDPENENSAAFMADAYAKYGDMLLFDDSSGVPVATNDALLERTFDRGLGSSWMLALCFALALAVFGAAAFARSRRAAVYQPVQGNAPAAMDQHAVESALQQSVFVPDDRVLRSIRHRLDVP